MRMLNWNQLIPSYLYAPALTLVWMLAAWLVKSVLFRRLKKWAERTSVTWDDLIVGSLDFPANFLILASAVAVFTYLLPLPEKAGRIATIALQGAVIFSIVIFLDRLSDGLIRQKAGMGQFKNVSSGVVKALIRGFIMGIGALILLDLMGISITPILASLGIGSLAVALALQDTLSNFFAGVYLAVDKPLEEGHFVRLESGQEGYVSDVGWRSTKIRLTSNNIVTLPNSKIMSSVITNYYLPDPELAVVFEMGVAYDSDLAKVERVISEVGTQIMKTVPGGVEEFQPFARFHTFGESEIRFSVILRAKEFNDGVLVKHEFVKAIHERFKKEGIVIPYPTRTVEIKEVLKR